MCISLQAVKQISAAFKPYTSVQRISQVWRRILEVQGEIRTHLDADFDKLYVVLLYANVYCLMPLQLHTRPHPPHKACTDIRSLSGSRRAWPGSPHALHWSVCF